MNQNNLKEYLKNIKWEKVIAAVFAISLTAIIFFDSTYWNHTLLTGIWVFAGVLFAVILTIAMLFAGFTIIKALVHAGASIALIVLLAESYCNLEIKTQAGLDALKFILLIGLLYIFYEFWTKFSEAGKEYWKKLGKDRNTLNGILTIVLFVFSVLMFGIALYQVVAPVVSNLCINETLENDKITQ